MLCCEGHPGRRSAVRFDRYGAIAWDEEDTRIRLRAIAHAWEASRRALREVAEKTPSVRLWPSFFFFLPATLMWYGRAVVQ